MTTLNVPFKEKDEAKALGARWNPAQKTWYVPDGLDLVNFDRWLPTKAVPVNTVTSSEVASSSVKSSSNEVRLKSTQPTSPSTPVQLIDVLATVDMFQAEPPQGVQLSTYLQRLSGALRKIYPQNEWVRAEISEWRQHRDTVYLSLVEHDANGQAVAKVNARIWSSYLAKLQDKFQQATGALLEPGIKVLLSVRAEFHIQYGLSLAVEDVDPTYTLGDMAAKLAKIRETLLAEKLIDANKQLPMPQEFVCVAVVAPKNAAGLGDFRREADLLQRFGLCEFHYFFATFQGQTASVSIAEALEQTLAAHPLQHFDALVIIRGGGAVTDLAWLNDLALARLVCRSPMAVLTGIGHERDSTILDEVACLRLDTPSKVIHHIFTRIKHNAQQAQTDFDTIIKTTQRWQQHYQEGIQHHYRLVSSLAQQHCQQAVQEMNYLQRTIEGQAQHRVESAANQIAQWQQAMVRYANEQQQRMAAQLEALIQQIQRDAQEQWQAQTHRVEQQYLAMEQQALFIQQHTKAIVDGLMREVLGQGPQQTLRRGFVIVRAATGEVLSSQQKSVTHRSFNLEFHDGLVAVENSQHQSSGESSHEL